MPCAWKAQQQQRRSQEWTKQQRTLPDYEQYTMQCPAKVWRQKKRSAKKATGPSVQLLKDARSATPRALISAFTDSVWRSTATERSPTRRLASTASWFLSAAPQASSQEPFSNADAGKKRTIINIDKHQAGIFFNAWLKTKIKGGLL